MKIVKAEDGTSYLIPFILVTLLFFLWGFAHSFLDILNRHFQEILVITKARSGLIQSVVYGGYFLMALPAGRFIRRFGYQKSVVLGLLLYAVGALLFIPGTGMMSFPFFLLCLFIIGCGLTFLETSANPYITVLGDPEFAASRLNLAQSFNGLGWIVGPLVGGLIVFGRGGSIALPYAVVGFCVLAVAVLFSRIKLPKIAERQVDEGNKDLFTERLPLFKRSHFVFGVIALFFYVAAQTGINSFFINFVIESDPLVSNHTAALMLSFGGMGLFMFGRMVGSRLMRTVPAEKLLLFCAAAAAVCMAVVFAGAGRVSVYALMLCYLFESIMFPTIFSLSIRGLGALTPQGSSWLIMSIVGGAVAPVLMGLLGEAEMKNGFVVPLFCFFIIIVYAFSLLKKKQK